MKIRIFPDKNYKALFDKKTGQTLRIPIDANKPVLPLDYPELLDVSLGNKCFGKCSYCYANGLKTGKNYSNVVEKVTKWFGTMTPNQRPFQVAIGGEGEPTLHPEFILTLYNFAVMGIVPNYTTNGMLITPDIINATKNYCGGVAISAHSHLSYYWRRALAKFSMAGVRTNLHFIIGEKGSAYRFINAYKIYNQHIDIFVLLPYIAIGRAKMIEVAPEWTIAFDYILEHNLKQIAFGALFYDFIREHKERYASLDISLYEPEIFSGYVKFDTEELIIRKSSFNPISRGSIFP